MTNKLNNSLNTEFNKSENVESFKRNKKWQLITLVVIILTIIGTCLLLLSIFSKEETANTEAYRFVNNNSTLCTHNTEQNQVECKNLQDNKSQTVTIPKEFKDLISIQPSHDGTKLLISLSTEPESTKFIVTDTNFTNRQDITLPYSLENGTEQYPQIIWGSSSDKLLISWQVREENDADFLPAPFVVWRYNITTKENKRIYKNGDNEVLTIKLVGASEEYLFITQPIYKNWVAKDTDPPADALLAVSLDDGFVRVVNIEQIVKYNNRNNYASGISIKYDPSISTFYINGQNQTSETDYDNFYAAANIIENNGLTLHEISRLTNQAQYYGITSTKGTLLADWSDELAGLNYSFIASPEEIHEIQDANPVKDNTKFTIFSLPNTN